MASVDLAQRATRLPGRTRGVLFFAFAFAVMADPVSSVAYAIEAALRALGGHLNLLLPTMGLVIGVIALVTLNYWQLVRAFPQGGGSPEAAGRAFGEQWSFLPIGALVVDFALTIAISIAAAGSALIAYVPALAPAASRSRSRCVAVAALTWFGHGGRLIFAVMTCLFIVASIAVLWLGWVSRHATHGHAEITHRPARRWSRSSWPSRWRWRSRREPRPRRRRSPSSASSTTRAARGSGAGPWP